MKIMKYIVPALLGGMLTLQSCEHFLDTKPTETYSEELVWGSRSTADAFVLRTYPDIFGIIPRFFGGDGSDNTKYNSTPKLSGRGT